MKHFDPNIQLISIVPNLVGGEGHTIPYHHAVSQAVQGLGWQHHIFIPQDANLTNLSQNWIPCLLTYDLEAESHLLQKVVNIYYSIRLGINLATQIEKHSDPSYVKILFLERFIHLQLLSLCLAVWLLPHHNLTVWLLYRCDTHKAKTRMIYKILNQLIKIKLQKNQFQLLTDSELLSQALSKYFKQKFQVLPIPHTDFKSQTNSNNLPKNQKMIWCWWPGSPRLEKGWKSIEKLSQITFKKRNNVGLIAAKSSNLSESIGGISIKLLPNRLSRDEYDQWLNFCDIVLLPYDSFAYQERTSGIFTEAIIAGKIPLVTANTWMAYELKQYDLESDLVLNWELPETVLNEILAIAVNPNIKEKIKKMQMAYQNFHNVENYGQSLKTLYQQSLI